MRYALLAFGCVFLIFREFGILLPIFVCLKMKQDHNAKFMIISYSTNSHYGLNHTSYKIRLFDLHFWMFRSWSWQLTKEYQRSFTELTWLAQEGQFSSSCLMKKDVDLKSWSNQWIMCLLWFNYLSTNQFIFDVITANSHFSFPFPWYQNVPLSLALSPRIISAVSQFKPDIIHASSPGIMVKFQNPILLMLLT